MIRGLYVASTLIASNPSAIGGAYAWRVTFDDREPASKAAVVSASRFGGSVTNNQMEMVALVIGLMRLPARFTGPVYSQSQVTLGRAFHGWKWSNMPQWVHHQYQEQRKRLTSWEQIKPVHVTSKDEHIRDLISQCEDAANNFMALIGANIPSILEVASL